MSTSTTAATPTVRTSAWCRRIHFFNRCGSVGRLALIGLSSNLLCVPSVDGPRLGDFPTWLVDERRPGLGGTLGRLSRGLFLPIFCRVSPQAANRLPCGTWRRLHERAETGS